jgi:hypothetical protein
VRPAGAAILNVSRYETSQIMNNFRQAAPVTND